MDSGVSKGTGMPTWGKIVLGVSGVLVIGLMAVTKALEASLGPDPFDNRPALSITEESQTRFCMDSILMRPDAPYRLEKMLEALPTDEDFVIMTGGLSRALKDNYAVLKTDGARIQWLVDHAWDVCALTVILDHHRNRYMRSVGLKD